MKVKIINKSGSPLPKYESALAAGVDVRALFKDISDIKVYGEDAAVINGELIIPPGTRVMIPTGIYMAIEEGYEAQVRSRSGKSLKEGLTIIQGVGTIN